MDGFVVGFEAVRSRCARCHLSLSGGVGCLPRVLHFSPRRARALRCAAGQSFSMVVICACSGLVGRVWRVRWSCILAVPGSARGGVVLRDWCRVGARGGVWGGGG
eukprot:4907258-Alexandrium_andersonii.AAC.1